MALKVYQYAFSPQPVIIAKDGYPVETHEVVTKDGYILELHRIPFGKNSLGTNGSPVLLMHGILSSSADWVLTGPEKGLGECTIPTHILFMFIPLIMTYSIPLRGPGTKGEALLISLEYFPETMIRGIAFTYRRAFN